jgi:hypothetical protein
VDDLLNACRIHGEWRWEKALQKQVLEHGDPEMGKHIVKFWYWLGLCPTATSLLLASEIEEAIEVRRRC